MLLWPFLFGECSLKQGYRERYPCNDAFVRPQARTLQTRRANASASRRHAGAPASHSALRPPQAARWNFWKGLLPFLVLLPLIFLLTLSHVLKKRRGAQVIVLFFLLMKTANCREHTNIAVSSHLTFLSRKHLFSNKYSNVIPNDACRKYKIRKNVTASHLSCK